MELFEVDRVLSHMRNLVLSWVAFSLTMTLDSIHTTLGKPIPAEPWLDNNFVRLQLESDGFQLIPNIHLPIEENYRFKGPEH